MRLSVSSVAFPTAVLGRLPRAARAAGVDGIAVTVSERGALRTDTPPDAVDAFHRQCRDEGLAVSSVYSYAGRRIVLDDAARAADVDLAKRCIDLAVRLEAPVCRLFAATQRGTDAQIDRFLNACTPVFDHAAACGVMLSFPTHHDLAYDAASCRRLVAGFGRARTGIIFTGPNLQLDGIAPLTALAEMYDLIEQVELKDWRRDGGHVRPVAIGTGEALVWPIVEHLAVLGYRGWITLHHLKQHHPDLPDLDRQVGVVVRRVADRARRAASADQDR